MAYAIYTRKRQKVNIKLKKNLKKNKILFSSPRFQFYTYKKNANHTFLFKSDADKKYHVNMTHKSDNYI